MQKIAVIGAGAWGTALAATFARVQNGGANPKITLWAHEAETVSAINQQHENKAFLEGVPLDDCISATQNMAEALNGAEAVVLVVPAQHIRAVCAQLAPLWPQNAPAVICAKGVELNSGLLMTQVVVETLPENTPLAVLSGPTFAIEVARGLPTAITLACEDAELGEKLVKTFGTATFRPYLHDDLIGAEVGGAVKNVLAIACGIVEGKGLGDNARAALLTRGLAELTRLAVAMGGKPNTLMGLCGMGDLLLTATSMQSRNFSFGFQVGEGKSPADILAERKVVTEGVTTAGAVTSLARKMNVDMPICIAVDGIINCFADVDKTIEGLLNRPFKSEHG